MKSHRCTLIERMFVFFGMKGCCPTHVPLPSGTDLSLSGTSSEGESLETDENPYQRLIDCRLHFSNTARPDITYVAEYSSRFMNKPTMPIWIATKHVLRYLKATEKLGGV